LPTASTDPEAVEAIQKLLEKHGLWKEFTGLNVSRLEKALAAGELPPELMTQLQAFQKLVIRDTVRVKKM
jgi:hypothetical protein